EVVPRVRRSGPEGSLSERYGLERLDRNLGLGCRLEEETLGLRLLAIIEPREDHGRHGRPHLCLSHVTAHESAGAGEPEIEQNATFVSVLVLKPSVAQALLGPRCVYTIAAEGLGDKKATNRAVGVFVPNRGQRQISKPRRRPVVGLDVAGD